MWQQSLADSEKVGNTPGSLATVSKHEQQERQQHDFQVKVNSVVQRPKVKVKQKVLKPDISQPNPSLITSWFPKVRKQKF